MRLLGHTELRFDGRSLAPQSGRVCLVLALLALDAGRVVSADRLIDQLWSDEQPRSGAATLHVYVSRLRKLLREAGVNLVTRAPGYLLEVPRSAVDVHLLAERVAAAEQAAAAGAWDTALTSARSAAELWRGEPFLDAAPCDDLRAETARLGVLRDRADELTARALLGSGRAAEAEHVAVELTARDRLNEAYWRLRVEAAHADGRAADALAAYQEYQAILADELGLDPSPAMSRLHRSVLGAGARPPAEVVPGPEPEPEPAPGPRVVSRLAERALVDRGIEAAVSGSGRMVCLEGEPGIGKTLLAEYAAARGRARGMAVVWARAVDGPGTPAMWMWEQVLAALPGGPGGSGAEQLRALAASSGEVDADPMRARFRLSEQLAHRVVAASGRQPLLIVLDDLQWADDGTVHALRLLGPLVRDHPLAVILTSRPPAAGSELATDLAMLAREHAVDRMALGPFTAADVAAYLADHGPSPSPSGSPAGSPADAATLHARSGGNPLFLTELVRNGVATSGVPATVSELVRQRLTALPPPTTELLDAAAVGGRRLEPGILGRAADVGAVELLERLAPALAEGLVVADGVARSWWFSHDLVRDAIVEQIAPHRRATLHHRLATAIADQFADELDDHADELAHHLYESVAGAPSRAAFEACMRAADAAVHRLAYDQAAVQRARALACLAPGASTRAERFEVLMSLTAERRLAGDVVGAAASLRSAVELARRLDDRARLIRAVCVLGGVTLWNWRHFGQVDAETVTLLRGLLDPAAGPLTPRQRAELAGTLAVELSYDPSPRAGEVPAFEAVDIARGLDDPVLLGRALNNLVIAIWRPGRDTERWAAVDEALSWVGRGLPTATEVVARLHRAPLALRAADLTGFDADLDRAADLVPTLGVVEIDGQISVQLAGRAMLRGEHALAAELIARSYTELRRTNLWAPEYTLLIQETTLARLQGRVGDVADRVIARAFEDVHRSLRWTAVLVLALAGDLAQARALQVRWGLQHLDRHTHWASSFEWAHAAELAMLLGAPAPAEVDAALGILEEELVVAGTAVAVWGPVAHLRSGLAAALGDHAASARHAEHAARVTARVTVSLGRDPAWCYPDGIGST